MKTSIVYVVMVFLAMAFLQGCGPSEEELRQQELARQDSLRQVYQAEMEQMRQDSLEQANRENNEPEVEEEEKTEFVYSENGKFIVQIESWRSEEKAQNQAERWRQRDFDQAFVVEYGNPEKGDVWYRVRLGRFDSLEMAENFKTFLETEYNTQSWISGTSDSMPDEAGAGS